DSSTTYATLTEGNITIGGKRVTAAELGVNTDASKAHEAINSLPDLRKLMQEQQAMSSAAGTVVSTSKQVAGDVFAYKSQVARAEYETELRKDSGRWDDYSKLDEAGKQNYLAKNSQGFQEALKWGTGGSYSRALDAVTAAIVGGLAGQGGGQVAANGLAPYAAEFIGSQFDPNHGKDPNATLQLISHALLGALLAEANGGSASNGALASGGGELAAKFLTDALYGGDPGKLDEQQKQTILALSQAVGALAGGLEGQGLASAGLGANIAGNSVENNRLLTAPERARIKELSNGDVAREAELTAAACALVKCSAGFAEGSDERAQWAAIEALGSTPAALEDRQWLAAQVLPGYIYTAGNGLATVDKLFDYGLGGYLSDLSDRNQLGIQSMGGVQLVGGGLQTAGAFVSAGGCEFVAPCILAGYLGVSGYDNAVAGYNTLISGKPTATWGSQLLEKTGLSPEVAELLYASTQLAAAAKAPVKNSATAPLDLTAAPPRVSNGILFDPRLPDPVAGLAYEPTILNSPKPNIANSHVNGYVEELRLANSVAALPDQVVVKYGDIIGRNGADVISVDVKTGAVTLWDNKFRSGPAPIKDSPTFASDSNALESAVREAMESVRASNLPAATKAKAIEQLSDGTFSAHTVGSGSAKNSTISKFCNGSICE
ncbi:VENN motif pre-toxin domain-containing protein, partial [Stenotrophomonas sp. 22385]|uniref:VENN motif pre-toxin domain-containing protein n=1 Tax=Stenotrophomonas sp. 22385 TaxID=3453915 RepID=UPI003F84AFAF